MTTEKLLRAAALGAIDRFCIDQGIATPPLVEREIDGITHFVGETPDGRKFYVGYKLAERDIPISGGFDSEGNIRLSATEFASSGVCWLDAAMLDEAKRYGWVPNGIETLSGRLVQVKRPHI